MTIIQENVLASTTS